MLHSIKHALTIFVRIMAILLFVVLQQAMVVSIGFILYATEHLVWGIVIWTLCIPMVYVNFYTCRYIMKYGFINFITMNADTSQIDVPRGMRWYDD